MVDPSELSDEAKAILELLRTAVSPERFAYDYTRQWRYLCLTPKEHGFLCDVLGVERPNVEFKPNKKAKDKTPDRKHHDLK